eukprot:SAG11_NODE_22940_length_397_cov_5.409396_1_plen_86_part_00
MLGFNRYQESKYRDRFKPENIVISYSTKDPIDTVNVTFSSKTANTKYQKITAAVVQNPELELCPDRDNTKFCVFSSRTLPKFEDR